MTEAGEAGEAGEVVARPPARTPHPTRVGGQDDGSYTNSLKKYIYTKVLVRCSSGFSAFVVFLHMLHMRKHRYLSHGSHFGTQNGRSGLPGCCWSARRPVPGLLRRRQCTRNAASALKKPFRACLSALSALKEAVRARCSRSLFKSAGLGYTVL